LGSEENQHELPSGIGEQHGWAPLRGRTRKRSSFAAADAAGGSQRSQPCHGSPSLRSVGAGAAPRRASAPAADTGACGRARLAAHRRVCRQRLPPSQPRHCSASQSLVL